MTPPKPGNVPIPNAPDAANVGALGGAIGMDALSQATAQAMADATQNAMAAAQNGIHATNAAIPVSTLAGQAGADVTDQVQAATAAAVAAMGVTQPTGERPAPKKPTARR